MAAGYTVETEGDVALVAATAKTIMSYINAANGVARLVEFSVSFDGVSATAEPVTIELCYSTEAGAGSSSSHTMAQIRGATRTAQGTAKFNYSSEPTTLTVWKRWLCHPQGSLTIQFPLGREPELIVTSDAMVIRCTAPAAVNAQGYMEVEEG